MKKTFNTVEHLVAFKFLWVQNINENYIKVIENIFNNNTSTTQKINIGKGVRQGDMFSPKLFPKYLESISQKMSWEGREVIINGESFMIYCLCSVRIIQ